MLQGVQITVDPKDIQGGLEMLRGMIEWERFLGVRLNDEPNPSPHDEARFVIDLRDGAVYRPAEAPFTALSFGRQPPIIEPMVCKVRPDRPAGTGAAVPGARRFKKRR